MTHQVLSHQAVPARHSERCCVRHICNKTHLQQQYISKHIGSWSGVAQECYADRLNSA